MITERINEKTAHIDEMSTIEMVRAINDEDKTVAYAVEKVLPEVARAIDEIAERMSRGGRLFYLGAGTSGRLGVLDASECPPTYGVPSEMVQGVIAGGYPALIKSSENAEDSGDEAIAELKNRGFGEKDVCFGISASGSAAYVREALRWAHSLGALTVIMCCNPEAPVCAETDIAIAPVVGAEVIAGSSRMKAGTATKMVLNMVSTGVMVRLGRVRGNRMVYVHASNKKLIERATQMVAELAGVPHDAAEQALRDNGMSVDAAVRAIAAMAEEK